MPTLINRGLGLLEVIMPRGCAEEVVMLVPGQRDRSGFWFPEGYTDPSEIFTPQQRRLQDKQRQVQRRRHGGRTRTFPTPKAMDGGPNDAAACAPHAPPARSAAFEAAPSHSKDRDRFLPLPSPLAEAPPAAPPARTSTLTDIPRVAEVEPASR